MHVRLIRNSMLLAAITWSTACEPQNPARPSMSFAAPSAGVPAADTAYNHAQQPVSLAFPNVARTGRAAVTYAVDVSTSPTFGVMVFSATGITEGSGTTTVQLPILPGNTTYYWRSRAVVDGIEGESSAVLSFLIRPAIVFQPPALLTPAAGTPIFTARPTFTLDNSQRSGQPATVFYEFQVSVSEAFSPLSASATVGEQLNRTSWTPGADLPEGTLYWRARAIDTGSGAVGGFSAAAAFERRGFGSSGDQLDLAAVTVVLGPANIASWPATGTVTSTVAMPGEVCIDHTKIGTWPGAVFFDDPGTLTQGNQWMFAFINGRWYGGAGRWGRPGQACKSTNADDGFSGTFYMDGAEPLRSYVPKAGDLVGLMASTPARFYPSMRTVDERTNVVVVRWGG